MIFQHLNFECESSCTYISHSWRYLVLPRSTEGTPRAVTEGSTEEMSSFTCCRGTLFQNLAARNRERVRERERERERERRERERESMGEPYSSTAAYYAFIPTSEPVLEAFLPKHAAHRSTLLVHCLKVESCPTSCEKCWLCVSKI